MISFLKRRGFRFGILEIFVPLIIITVFIIVTNFYYRSSQALLSLSDQIVNELSQKVIERTINFLDPASTSALLTAHEVREFDTIKDEAELLDYMWQHIVHSPQIFSLYVADTYGNFIQARRTPEFATRVINRRLTDPNETWHYRNEDYSIHKSNQKVPQYDPRFRPWYNNTEKELKIYWSDMYIFSSTGQPGITASYPVVREKGLIQAIIGADITLAELSTFLSKQKVSENGIVFISNEKDDIIAYPDINKVVIKDKNGTYRSAKVNELDSIWIKDAYVTHKKKQLNKSISETSGERYVTTVTAFPGSFGKRWKIITVIPEKDLLGSVYKMIIESIAISILILLISIIIVGYFSGRISKPIVELTQQTELIKNFHLESVKNVTSRFKEIQLMNEAIQHMNQGLKAFKKYIPSELVRQLVQQGKDAKLGGEKKELTLFYSEIIDFFKISEQLPPDRLTIHLSEYMEHISLLIMDNQGTIDKFIEDQVKAFWGAPVDLPDSPLKACQTALNCVKEIKILNEKWQRAGKPELNTNFGIHTGPLVVGNVGSNDRMDYTVIGHSVRVCNRILKLNDVFGTQIIISENTYQQVKNYFICRPLEVDRKSVV